MNVSGVAMSALYEIADERGHGLKLSVHIANSVRLSLVDDCGAIRSHGNGSCIDETKSH